MRPSSLSVAPAIAAASPPICCAAPGIALCSTCAVGLLHGRGRDCRWLCDIPSGRTLCAVRKCSFPLCAVRHGARAAEDKAPALPRWVALLYAHGRDWARTTESRRHRYTAARRRARRPRTRAMQRCAPYLVSGGFRRQHTVVQIRKRVINLFDCSQCRLIGVIEHIALRQFAHVPASRQVHPRTVRFAGIVSSS